jgi:hypothetical protein
MVKFFWDVGGGIYRLKQYGFSSQLEINVVLNQKMDALQYILSYLQSETKKLTQAKLATPLLVDRNRLILFIIMILVLSACAPM